MVLSPTVWVTPLTLTNRVGSSMAHRSRRAIAERRVLRIERAVAAAGYERGNQNERGKPTSKLILHARYSFGKKSISRFISTDKKPAAFTKQRSAPADPPSGGGPSFTDDRGASLSTALEPPFVRYSMPEPCDDYAGAVPIGTHLSIAAAVQAGRRRLTPPQSPLSDRRHLLYFSVS